MAPQFQFKFPPPGIADDDPGTYFDRITARILVAVAAVLLVALVLAAELRLTPEQRLDLFEVTTYASP